MIHVHEGSPGIITVCIHTSAYGQAGAHWRGVLKGPNHGGYGRIYIQRSGANERRNEACAELRWHYRGQKGANVDECPGAMFIWTGGKLAHVEAVDAIDNQKLGRDLGGKLRRFKQKSPKDLWEVRFRFV